MTEANIDSIRQPIKGFIQQRFPAFGDAGPDDHVSLLEGGAVDSLGLLDLVSYLEETFGVQFEDDELVTENFGTVDQLAQFVSQKRARQ